MGVRIGFGSGYIFSHGCFKIPRSLLVKEIIQLSLFYEFWYEAGHMHVGKLAKRYSIPGVERELGKRSLLAFNVVDYRQLLFYRFSYLLLFRSIISVH